MVCGIHATESQVHPRGKSNEVKKSKKNVQFSSASYLKISLDSIISLGLVMPISAVSYSTYLQPQRSHPFSLLTELKWQAWSEFSSPSLLKLSPQHANFSINYLFSSPKFTKYLGGNKSLHIVYTHNVTRMEEKCSLDKWQECIIFK